MIGFYSSERRIERRNFANNLSKPVSIAFNSLMLGGQVLIASMVILGLNSFAREVNPRSYFTVMNAIERVGGPVADGSRWLQTNRLGTDFESLKVPGRLATEVLAEGRFLGGKILN